MNKVYKDEYEAQLEEENLVGTSSTPINPLNTSFDSETSLSLHDYDCHMYKDQDQNQEETRQDERSLFNFCFIT